MASDTEQLVLSISADVSQINRALKRLEGDAKKTGNVIQGSFGGQASKSMNALQADAKNLSFQLNDIATGLAGGSSPFTIMNQQMGQVMQLMGGRGLAGSLSLLKSAFAVAFPALGLMAAVEGLGMLVDYMSDAGEESKDAAKALKEQRDLIRDVAKEWGDALPGLKAYNEELERQEGIQKQIQGLQAATAQVTDKLQAAFDKINVGRIEDAFSAFKNIPKYAQDVAEWQRQWASFQEAMKDGTATQDQYNKLQQLTNKLMQELPMSSLDALQARWLTAQDSISGYLKLLQETIKEEKNLVSVQAQTAAAINRAVPMPSIGAPVTSGAGVFNPSQTEMENYKKAKEAAEQAAKDAEREATQAAKEAARKAEQELKEAAEKLTSAIVRQSAVAVDYAATMIDKSETANRGEVNAFLGNKIDAAQTAWCAAFVNAALAKVGITGSGSNIATDFLNFGQGVDLKDVQKGDVLVQPRGHKAGETGGHVGFATGGLDVVGGEIKRIEILSGNASDKVTKEWVDASSVVARRATDAFQLPAGALDHLTESSKTAKKALTEVEQAALDIQKATQAALGGLIRDLIDGKDASESLASALGKIADQMLEIGLNNLFKMGSGAGAGGLLGGMIIPGILHDGGIAGKDGYGSGRMVPASAFRGARRYHNGGIAGGEVPAILKRGEIVLPSSTSMRRAGAGQSGEDVNIRLHDDSGRMAAIADQRIQTASGTIVKVSVVQSTKSVQAQLPGMMANAQVRAG